MITRLVAALLFAVPCLAGCHQGQAARGNDERYVALGDSYTSGAGLPGTRPGAAGCGQSALAYPTLVAKALDVRLTDVSCGGATTEDGTELQLDAVTRGTDLVTVGLGGNDFAWFLGAMFGCTTIAASDRSRARGCTTRWRALRSTTGARRRRSST